MERVLHVCLDSTQGHNIPGQRPFFRVRGFGPSRHGSAKTPSNLAIQRRRRTDMKTFLAHGIPAKAHAPDSRSGRRGSASRGPRICSGNLSLGERSQRPSNGFHQHHRTRPVTCRNCCGGPDVCFRRRGIETHSRRCAVRCWHGNRGSEFPRVAVSRLLNYDANGRKSTWQTQGGLTESIGRFPGH